MHFQQDETSNDGVWLKPFFVDEDDWTRKLGKGLFCKSSCFFEDVKTLKGNSMCEDDVIKRWDSTHQRDPLGEALGWLGCQGTEIDELCFKST